jgi:hypothetical protein
MTEALHIEAAARALAMSCGALTLAEAVAWADGLILAEAEPPGIAELTELSLARTPAAALSALGRFGRPRNEAETAAMARAACRLFHAALAAGRADAGPIAKALYHLAMEDALPAPGTASAMFGFWDELDLARDGIYGDPAAVETALRAFLAEHGADPGA